MTPAQLNNECIRLGQMMSDKSYFGAKVSFYVNWLYADSITANIECRATDGGSLIQKFPTVNVSEGWEGVIKATESYINDLPSVKDTQRNQFLAAVGKLIDQGREIGIEVDFLNPLTEMMKNLSTNIITDQTTPEMPF
jgi:hypothetical protein